MPFLRRERDKRRASSDKRIKVNGSAADVLGPQNASHHRSPVFSPGCYFFLLLILMLMSVLCYEVISIKMGSFSILRKGLQAFRHAKLNRLTSRVKETTLDGIPYTEDMGNYTGNKFSTQEIKKIRFCVTNYPKMRESELTKTRQRWKERWTSHQHLTTQSTVIEFGGHLGSDFKGIYDMYQPKRYLVLEPVPKYYDFLANKYGNLTGVKFYNFGIGDKTQNVTVGRISDGTSIFRPGMTNSSTDALLQIYSVEKAFEIIGIENMTVDLLTMNCEGCEYAVLEFLLSRRPALLKRFHSIQLQPHFYNVKALDPLRRYCQYQELLARKFSIVFQHKYWWEAWRLNSSVSSQLVL